MFIEKVWINVEVNGIEWSLDWMCSYLCTFRIRLLYFPILFTSNHYTLKGNINSHNGHKYIFKSLESSINSWSNNNIVICVINKEVFSSKEGCDTNLERHSTSETFVRSDPADSWKN